MTPSEAVTEDAHRPVMRLHANLRFCSPRGTLSGDSATQNASDGEFGPKCASCTVSRVGSGKSSQAGFNIDLLAWRAGSYHLHLRACTCWVAGELNTSSMQDAPDSFCRNALPVVLQGGVARVSREQTDSLTLNFPIHLDR